MLRHWTTITAGLVGGLLACTPAPNPGADGAEASADTAAAPAAAQDASQALACQPTAPLADRASPYDSTLVTLGGATAKVCYGRPSAKGRTVFGQLVPYDTLWRTGANEPTIIHLPFAAEIADIDVAPGSYALYTVPGQEQWTVIVNRSTSQWGHESQYTSEVRAQEVGRAQVSAERTDSAVETFTIRAEPGGDAADEAFLVLEWENTRVRIPIERT